MFFFLYLEIVADVHWYLSVFEKSMQASAGNILSFFNFISVFGGRTFYCFLFCIISDFTSALFDE